MEQERSTGGEPRSPAGTTQDRPKAPASPRTLRAWRRIGLVLGVPAAVLLVATVVLRAVPGPGHAWYAALAVPGVLGGLVSVVFLRRV